MTKDEALKMAIEALNTLMMEKGSVYQKAIQACKEALEQPAQKTWRHDCMVMGYGWTTWENGCRHCGQSAPSWFNKSPKEKHITTYEQPYGWMQQLVSETDGKKTIRYTFTKTRIGKNDIPIYFEEALEQPAYETESWKNNMKEAEKILAKAKFANEQPAQEPAYQVGEIVNPYGSNIKIKQPAQEPVAWISGGGVLTKLKSEAQLWIIKGGTAIPLYSHPAPSWQGLSDDEIREIDDVTLGAEYFEEQATEFARAIEAKVKEKNT